MNIQGHEAKFHAFLAQNTAFWRENTGYPRDENSRLYVDLAHDNPAYLLANLWVAKYIQKLRGGRVIGLAQSWPKLCPAYQFERVRELAHSFLLEEVIDLESDPEDISAITQRFAGTIEGLKGHALREAILQFDSANDPDLGWVLYDTWLREEFRATIDVCEPGFLDCAHSVFRTRQAVSRAMRSGKTIGVVAGHYHYSPYSFMALEAARQNAPVYFPWIFVPVTIRKFASADDVRRGRAEAFLSTYEQHFSSQITAERLQRWKRRMFDVQGGTREFFRVVEGKAHLETRSEFLAQLKLDPERPVVCFYVPALCAAPHCFGGISYDDFGDWLRQSLQIAAELPEVNFIVKRHPQDRVYDRSDLIGRLENLYGHGENIRFLNTDVPAEQMANVCDLVALMSGTPGYEMAARGIATATAGPSRYSGLGFAREAETVEGYRDLLAHAGEQRLTDDERESALRFAYFELAAGRSPSLFLPRVRMAGTADFWTEAELNVRSKYVEEDPLFRNMKYMIEQDLPFLLNTDLVKARAPNVDSRASESDTHVRRFYSASVTALYALEDRAIAAERRHTAGAEQVTQALALAANLMKYGGSVQFGSGHIGNYLLGWGWSTPESEGVWTNGHSAEIKLPWVAGQAILCLECYAYTPEFSPIRVIELSCNDVELDRKEFSGPASPSIWSVEIASKAAQVQIRLRIPEPATPGEDPRLLGLWLSRLWVIPDLTKRPWEIARY